MLYRQKKAHNDLKFDILPTQVTFSLKDDSTTRTYELEYEQFTGETYEFLEKNDSYKNYSLYLLVLSIIFGAATFFAHISSSALIFLIGSGIVYLLYLRSQTKFTVVSGDKNLLIIQDKQHDEILNAFQKARKHYLRKTYFKVDHTKEPSQELHKFAWLLKHKMITQKEHDDARSELLVLN